MALEVLPSCKNHSTNRVSLHGIRICRCNHRMQNFLLIKMLGSLYLYSITFGWKTGPFIFALLSAFLYAEGSRIPASDNSNLVTQFPLLLSVPFHSSSCTPHPKNVFRAFLYSPQSHTLNPRNPDHHSRPTFEGITNHLARDREALLSWSEEDRTASPNAAVLGAPLEEGLHLYQELQEKYKWFHYSVTFN